MSSPPRKKVGTPNSSVGIDIGEGINSGGIDIGPNMTTGNVFITSAGHSGVVLIKGEQVPPSILATSSTTLINTASEVLVTPPIASLNYQRWGNASQFQFRVEYSDLSGWTAGSSNWVSIGSFPWTMLLLQSFEVSWTGDCPFSGPVCGRRVFCVTNPTLNTFELYYIQSSGAAERISTSDMILNQANALYVSGTIAVSPI